MVTSSQPESQTTYCRLWSPWVRPDSSDWSEWTWQVSSQGSAR